MTPTIIEQVKEALLLSARWFKINHDCEDDTPNNKEDLASMSTKMLKALALLDQLPPPMTEAEREKLVEEMAEAIKAEMNAIGLRVAQFQATDVIWGSEFNRIASAALAVIERRKGE